MPQFSDLHYDPVTGDFARIGKSKGKQVVGTLKSDGYIRIRYKGGRYYAHVLAWFFMTGNWPTHRIDHRNLDRADNRWENLRPSTHQLNCVNTGTRPQNKCGYKGVYKQANFWRSCISYNGTTIHLGSFPTAQSAYLAYVKKGLELYGEYFNPGEIPDELLETNACLL